jgi:hypothetical protein
LFEIKPEILLPWQEEGRRKEKKPFGLAHDVIFSSHGRGEGS